MINNSFTNAVNLMSSAQNRAAKAGHDIASTSATKETVNSTQPNTHNLTKSIISLKKAEIESASAVKILQAEDERLGTLFKAIA